MRTIGNISENVILLKDIPKIDKLNTLTKNGFQVCEKLDSFLVIILL